MRNLLFLFFSFAAPRKCFLSREYACFLYILPRPSWPMRPPGVLKSPWGAPLSPYFTWVSATLPKNMHSSRLKCTFSALPKNGRQSRAKRDDSLVQKRRYAKNLRHSALECQFSFHLLRKRLFRSRGAKALIFCNGKYEYFCSIFGSPRVNSEQKYPDLPLLSHGMAIFLSQKFTQKRVFVTLARNGYFWSRVCP